MDDKELEDARVLLIGCWDVLGRTAPKLFDEIKSKDVEIAELKKEHEYAREVLNVARWIQRRGHVCANIDSLSGCPYCRLVTELIACDAASIKEGGKAVDTSCPPVDAHGFGEKQ